MRKSFGFTLIEILIVIVIISTLLSFVAPVGIKQVERAQYKKDLLEIKRVLINVSNYSFSSGSVNDISFRNSEIKINSLNKIIKLKKLSFKNEFIVKFNRNGYPDRRVLRYQKDDSLEEIDIFEVLFPEEFEYVYAK
nr:prepilin-type N-terminal cleavage/methylation domain-containing protein [Pseudoalteromonas shioyasakiensis]